MMRYSLLLAALTLWAGPPVLMELEPRGAERGRPFTLTVKGRDIPAGARIWSTMPATFTPVVSTTARGPQFLVEPTAELQPGVYPIRIEAPTGISNVLLFSIGAFPELVEEESRQYSEPHRNDTIEKAEPLQTVPVTVNGTLQGAERDVYRIAAKAGETRVFEVDARRCGSAIDPVLRILDASGKQLARVDDAAGLDARLQYTFPREGMYYVEVHDARFSKQVQNYYRLKMGSYSFADTVFPLGGQRGKTTAVTFAGGNLTVPVKSEINLTGVAETEEMAFASLRNSPAMPFLFAVSEYPEVIEPASAITVPTVINGRLMKEGEVDRYKIRATPGDRLLIEVQARELGSSKIEAILTAFDAAGKKIDSAGDKPLPEDVFAVQGTSRTSRDPFLNLTVPKDTNEVTISLEDLALRGGPQYGYRIVVRQEPEDFRLITATPAVNVPAGGTAFVTVVADRRGYDGPIQLTIPDLPKGVKVEGGIIPRETMDSNNARTINRRGALLITADPGVEVPAKQLVVWGEGKTDDGKVLRRRARVQAMAVDVAGATAQGVVDRQRPVTAPWISLDLPAATTTPAEAVLEVKQASFTRMEEGDRWDFTYEWKVRTPGQRLPETLGVDVVGARDIRVTAQQKKGMGGVFSISTTKATEPATYDVVVSGRIGTGMAGELIYARPLPLVVTERSSNVQAASNQ